MALKTSTRHLIRANQETRKLGPVGGQGRHARAAFLKRRRVQRGAVESKGQRAYLVGQGAKIMKNPLGGMVPKRQVSRETPAVQQARRNQIFGR